LAIFGLGKGFFKLEEMIKRDTNSSRAFRSLPKCGHIAEKSSPR
jgi:hypothetical protein